MMDNNAKYVWYEKKGNGRNLYGLFRKTFEVKGIVKSAIIKMFADSYYTTQWYIWTRQTIVFIKVKYINTLLAG